MSELQVPGFDAVELLGYGSGGEVWLARDRTTGTPVALKRLRADADLAARDRLRREAAVLAGVEHPHVVRLRSVVADGDALVLVLDLAPGGSLSRLLATRGRLTAGEVVTLAVPLAQALAAVHAQGLVHGDVTPGNVLFTAGGRPLLSDLGVARLLGVPAGTAHGTPGYLDPAVAAGGPAGPATDVHGLAATCLAALTGAAPYTDDGRRRPLPDGCHLGLVAALEPALAPDPGDRPGAEDLAVAVFDAAAAVPVRLPADPSPWAASPGSASVAATHRVSPRPPVVPDPAPELPRRRFRPDLRAVGGRLLRSRGRGAVAVGAVGAAVTLAAVTGVAWAGAGDDSRPAGLRSRPSTQSSGSAAPTPTATPTVSPAPVLGWVGTLARLDRLRSRAYAGGDVDGLRAVYAAGSPALSRDAAVLARLTGRGLRAEGLRLTATGVSVAQRSPGRVRLAVTDVMPPYRLVDPAGRLVEQRTGRGLRSWTVVLSRTGGEWRVYDVVRG